jgi:hypothetical protein
MFSFFKRRRASRDAAAAGAPPGGTGEHATGDAHSAGPAGAAHTGGTVQPASATGDAGSPDTGASPQHSSVEAVRPAASGSSGFGEEPAQPSAVPEDSPPSGSPPPASPPSGQPPTGAERPPPRGLALDEITRGMQHAAAAANQLLAQQYTAVLDQFFDQDEDGLLSPREVEVALDAKHTMPVPLVALATPRGLALERMVVHLTVRADFAEALSAGSLAGNDQLGRFYVTLAPPSAKSCTDGNTPLRDSQHIDIEMQFAALAPPEAIMRVIDEYTHRLLPRARSGDEENSHA